MTILSIFNNFWKICIFSRTLTSARRSWVTVINTKKNQPTAMTLKEQSTVFSVEWNKKGKYNCVLNYVWTNCFSFFPPLRLCIFYYGLNKENYTVKQFGLSIKIFFSFLPGSGSETNSSGSRKKFRIQPDPDSQHWFLK